MCGSSTAEMPILGWYAGFRADGSSLPSLPPSYRVAERMVLFDFHNGDADDEQTGLRAVSTCSLRRPTVRRSAPSHWIRSGHADGRVLSDLDDTQGTVCGLHALTTSKSFVLAERLPGYRHINDDIDSHRHSVADPASTATTAPTWTRLPSATSSSTPSSTPTATATHADTVTIADATPDRPATATPNPTGTSTPSPSPPLPKRRRPRRPSL